MRMMKRIFSILIVIVFAALVMGVDHCSESTFLEKFMEDRSLLIMGTILSIYIVASLSFLTILMTHEKKEKEVVFSGSRSELKTNILALIALFAFQFLLLSATPSAGVGDIVILKIFMTLKVVIFSLYIYALYELSMALIFVVEKLNSTAK